MLFQPVNADLSSCFIPGFGYTERSEQYAPDDTASRSATLDLKGRGRGRGGSVPFAENEDDRNLASVDPAYYGRDGEVGTYY